ncbi:MAG: exodeoxyribonuclease VII small subunit [Gemmataceae bacterium]|jgi:exodeoxyribonuclease VII small subunit|nr:exodeoxyribonuclease VII small subunit [Gemmataceae bacterium]
MADLSLEQALIELEKILRCLEDGTTTLEESLLHYEKGIGYLKFCYAQLQNAEQKIAILANWDGEGKPKFDPFTHSTTQTADQAELKRTAPRRPPDSPGAY